MFARVVAVKDHLARLVTPPPGDRAQLAQLVRLQREEDRNLAQELRVLIERDTVRAGNALPGRSALSVHLFRAP